MQIHHNHFASRQKHACSIKRLSIVAFNEFRKLPEAFTNAKIIDSCLLNFYKIFWTYCNFYNGIF